jgi:hypothetical protein
MLMTVCSLAVAAQDEKNVTLDEVTVKGARIVQKVDGQWIYPTKQQIAASPNGYSLLAKLTLPHIRVDEAMNSITALTNLGTAQVRINDIVATREDLQTLDMQGVEHIEFIDNPGVRYGEGIAYDQYKKRHSSRNASFLTMMNKNLKRLTYLSRPRLLMVVLSSVR